MIAYDALVKDQGGLLHALSVDRVATVIPDTFAALLECETVR